MQVRRTQVFAHRGYSAKAPENSMAAFQLAWDVKADGIELDVHLSKDGQVVVIHDETLERTTSGRGFVVEHTVQELKRYSNGSWFSLKYAEETIPTLREVLEWLESTGMVINIELKNNRIAYRGLEEKVIAEIERVGLEKRVILSSFNHESLKHLHAFRPHYSLAALYDFLLFKPWKYAKALGVSAVHPDYRSVTEKMVAKCRQAGIAVRPYTVDRGKDLKRMFALGVDAVFTNEPRRALMLQS
jgi:glycerophosphoryl diester phosphodiesterase